MTIRRSDGTELTWPEWVREFSEALKQGDEVTIGTIMRCYTGDAEGTYVPCITTSEVLHGGDEEGKQWVTVFPGPHKDDQNLQAPANEMLCASGTGKYEIAPL